MTKLLRSLISGMFLALVVLSPLHAQTAANAPAAGTPPVSANPAPTTSSQAPDEVMQRLSALSHAGKYAEAQQLTTALLLAYPDDQRLIKAKAVLEKLLTSPGPAIAPGPTATPAGAAAGPAAPKLAGMDKVQYDSLIERARQAQQTTDLAEQKALLQRFMEDSSGFLQKHPEQLLLWQIRAASALTLNDPDAGYEAGQKLLAASAADSAPNLHRLLAQLNLKGWLDKERMDRERAEQRRVRSEAETILTEAAGAAGLPAKLSEFTPEGFVVTDWKGRVDKFRYDQIKTFDVVQKGYFCYVALRGEVPSDHREEFLARTAGDPRHKQFTAAYLLVWKRGHRADADKFASALSTLTKLARGQQQGQPATSAATPVR